MFCSSLICSYVLKFDVVLFFAMASPIVDPSKVKYYPEMLPEILNEPSVTTAGQRVASYLLAERNLVIEDALPFTQTAAMDFIISADSRERARIRADSPTLGDARRYSKITARESAEFRLQMVTGGPAANVRSGWEMTFRKPLSVDKLRAGITLDTTEQPIADALHIAENLALGMIPYNKSLLNLDYSSLFTDVIPVEKTLAAIPANGKPIIGGSAISSATMNDQLIVLLGVYIDTNCLAAGTPSDTFIVVDRDGDPSYIKLDITGMPDNQYVPCYIPAINKLEVRVESTTGTGALTVPCGFQYGVRPLNYMDHLKWGIPYNSPLARTESLKIFQQYPSQVQAMRAGVY